MANAAAASAQERDVHREEYQLFMPSFCAVFFIVSYQALLYRGVNTRAHRGEASVYIVVWYTHDLTAKPAKKAVPLQIIFNACFFKML